MAVATQATIHASGAGARLDADIRKGGGTNDTAVLQAILDRAADGTPVHLIIDGVALVNGLNVYGNTTIECINGAGLYLNDGSSRAIIRNAHRSRGAITDEHITVRGCTLNGNRERQPSADFPRPDVPLCCTPSNRESDGTYITGLQFFGTHDLTIENVHLSNIRAYGAQIANAKRVVIRNLTIESNDGLGDGLQFKGPLQYVTVDGLKVRTGADGLAFSADTWPENQGNLDGPYVGTGPIVDVFVSNVHLMDANFGIRFMSALERIDRVTISHVTGTVNGWYVATLGHWINPSGLGNFGSIVFDNVNVDRWIDSTVRRRMEQGAKTFESWGEVGKAIAKDVNNGGYFAINGQVENLTLRNIITKVSDSRPILWVGPHARVGQLTAELTLFDPNLQALPVKLEQGSIERLDLSLRWNGRASDQGKNALFSYGGRVGQLNWVSTPPMYLGAEMIGSNSVIVTFTQPVKAVDFKGGVDIKVDGKPVAISHAMHEPARADAVRYVLKQSVRGGGTVTWAYNAASGCIQNLSGDQLLAVSEKAITNR